MTGEFLPHGTRERITHEEMETEPRELPGAIWWDGHGAEDTSSGCGASMSEKTRPLNHTSQYDHSIAPTLALSLRGDTFSRTFLPRRPT